MSLEMPETGFRSVSPSARTPMMLSTKARSKANSVKEIEIMPRKENWTEKTQNPSESRSPINVVLTPIRCSGGASWSSSGSSPAFGGFEAVLLRLASAMLSERFTGAYP